MSLLKNIPAFSSLPTDALTALENQARIRQYAKNIVVYCEGDMATTLFIVINGAVKTYTSNEKGRKFVLCECGSGDMFGVIEILGKSERFCSAVTMEYTTIAVIQEADFRAALSASPALWKSLSISLAQNCSQLTWNLKNMALFNIQGRVKNLLLASSIKRNGQIILDRRMTQQEIADRIGATRESVSHVLANMKKSGILCERNGRFVLRMDKVSPTTTV